MSNAKQSRASSSKVRDGGDYFITVEAKGAVNRVVVNSKSLSDTSVFLNLAALRSTANGVKTSYFDLKVVAPELCDEIIKHRAAIEDNDTEVFGVFRMMSPYANVFYLRWKPCLRWTDWRECGGNALSNCVVISRW